MPTIIRYPLDPTGVNPNNYVQGETHTLLRRKIRAVAPTYGAFFAESIHVVDTAANRELVKGIEYDTVELYELPTAQFGKEIHAVILIKDENVGDEISISYQALGGEYSASATAIIHMIESLDLDNRPVDWGDLISKPNEFEPTEHLHDAGDLYGFEYVTNALERIARAVVQGDHLSHDAIYRYIDDSLNTLAGGMTRPQIEEFVEVTVSQSMQAYIAVLANTAASSLRQMQSNIVLADRISSMTLDYDHLLTRISNISVKSMTSDVTLKFRMNKMDDKIREMQAAANP